jgi:type IV pilus assembly protein PilQ
MFYRVLVFAFLFPAFAFSYTVVRSDGKTFSGELIQQTPESTLLKGKDGITIRFHSNQIDWNRTTASIQQDEKLRASLADPSPPTHQTREIAKRKQWTGEPFTFDFKDIDIKDFFRFVADISGLNVILDPAVHGTITMKLTDVPWDQALDLVSKNEGLGYTIEGNVIRIAPLSKIVQEEQMQAQAEKEKMLNAPLVTIIKHLSYAKATAMEPIVRKLLTPKGSIITDARTNTLIITDIDKNIANITGTVDGLD